MPGWQVSCNFIVTYVAGGVNVYRKTPDADASGVERNYSIWKQCLKKYLHSMYKLLSTEIMHFICFFVLIGVIKCG